MTRDENLRRAVRFERPDFIPVGFHINGACWHHYDQAALQDLMAAHPLLFPGFSPAKLPITHDFPAWARAGVTHTDTWGCVWTTTDDGIMGSVIRHPLHDWAAFEGYRAPDPLNDTGWGATHWADVAASFREAQASDPARFRRGSLRHGHTFLMLQYLRGYEGLLYDMADDEPRLHRLMGLLEDYNLAVVRRFLALGANWMGYPEDLGAQVGPMLSPAQFRRFIKPTYQRLMAPARAAGCVVHMHSDGDIRTLVDDLIDGGVEVVNLQDLVNGIAWIKERLAGRVCLDLDVDRQRITRFGTPAQIDALIRDEVTQLGRREGGLIFTFGLYPGTPLANVAALMDAFEKYATHFN